MFNASQRVAKGMWRREKNVMKHEIIRKQMDKNIKTASIFIMFMLEKKER